VSVVEDGASIGLTVAAIFAPLLVLVFLAAAGYGAWRLLRRLRRGDTAVDAH
jgi:TRAP-type C4-dicarboxylate transport system permease small subunit